MKKLFLLLLAFVFAQTIMAQGRLFFMPKFSLGTTSIEIGDIYGDKKTVCSNLAFGFTFGKTEQKTNYRYFIGALLERNGYGFQSTCRHEKEDINVGTGSWKFGFNMMFKRNYGLVYGGTLGYIVWDDVHTIVESGHNDCGNVYFNPNNGFSIVGHAGYGWNHVLLLLNLGYESGIICSATADFPLFSLE